MGVDAGGRFHSGRRMAQGVGDPGGRHVADGVATVVSVDRSEGRGIRAVEPESDAAESFAGAQEVVGGGAMGNGLASNACFLVRERESRMRDARECFVIQKRGRRGEYRPIQGEGDVMEPEGLGTCVAAAVEVLGRAEEPEESDDQEVKDVGVGRTVGVVLGVEDLLGCS